MMIRPQTITLIEWELYDMLQDGVICDYKIDESGVYVMPTVPAKYISITFNITKDGATINADT